MAYAIIVGWYDTDGNVNAIRFSGTDRQSVLRDMRDKTPYYEGDVEFDDGASVRFRGHEGVIEAIFAGDVILRDWREF